MYDFSYHGRPYKKYDDDHVLELYNEEIEKLSIDKSTFAFYILQSFILYGLWVYFTPVFWVLIVLYLMNIFGSVALGYDAKGLRIKQLKKELKYRNIIP